MTDISRAEQVARIAGNILSGHRSIERIDHDGLLNDSDKRLARWAVSLARCVVAETERTEPVAPPDRGVSSVGTATK